VRNGELARIAGRRGRLEIGLEVLCSGLVLRFTESQIREHMLEDRLENALGGGIRDAVELRVNKAYIGRISPTFCHAWYNGVWAN
jgi:hypothetical protein